METSKLQLTRWKRRHQRRRTVSIFALKDTDCSVANDFFPSGRLLYDSERQPDRRIAAAPDISDASGWMLEDVKELVTTATDWHFA